MRRSYVFFLAALAVFLGAGCKKVTALKKALTGPETDKQIIKPVETVGLAKAILLPRPYQFSLSRDPFRPLIEQVSQGPVSLDKEGSAYANPGIKLVGILKRQDKSLALLEMPQGEGVGVFREGDKLSQFTIKKIEAKRVILEKENERLILEIGDEK